MQVRSNGISIEVEDTGAGLQVAGPAVLLVMGLGMQLVAWPQQLVDTLVGEGYRVIRFDNRDCGLSEHLNHLGTPNLMWEGFKHRIGFPVRSPYTVADMAADALGVLDALAIEKAHVVGVSMGGMIAQRVAIAAPERVLSLASIMSSSGARHLPGPRAHVLQALLGRPRSAAEDDIVDHYMMLFKVIGSPGFPTNDAELRGRILRAVRRSFHPAGTVRQIAAVAADAARADELARIKAPSLVVHGEDDPLVPYVCGVDTARRIAGARLVGVPGMGHDLPQGVIERILEPLLPHMKAAA